MGLEVRQAAIPRGAAPAQVITGLCDSAQTVPVPAHTIRPAARRSFNPVLNSPSFERASHVLSRDRYRYARDALHQGAMPGSIRALGVVRAARLANADDALKRIAAPAHGFDLVLSDIVMPGSIDGMELAARVRRLPCGPPLILMSAYSESMEQAARLQFLVLPKPCAPQLLAEAILAAVKKSR